MHVIVLYKKASLRFGATWIHTSQKLPITNPFMVGILLHTLHRNTHSYQISQILLYRWYTILYLCPMVSGKVERQDYRNSLIWSFHPIKTEVNLLLWFFVVLKLMKLLGWDNDNKDQIPIHYIVCCICFCKLLDQEIHSK